MKNAFIFPGFCQNKTVYGNYNFVDLWEEKHNNQDFSNSEYLIGHSLGSIECLLRWRENRDAIVILFNPLIPRRSALQMIFRYIYLVFTSKGIFGRTSGVIAFKNIPLAFKKALPLLKIDPLEIIREIPEGNLIIVRGINDNYFCDSTSSKFLLENNIHFLGVENLGHNWVPEVDLLILKIIKKRFNN